MMTDMVNVTISREASKDLIHIRDYIRDELSNPDAAVRVIRMLRQNIEKLSDSPEHGKPLDAILPVHTEFRVFLCEHYRIFYLFSNNKVEVVRILHTLQDYMRALFL